MCGKGEEEEEEVVLLQQEGKRPGRPLIQEINSREETDKRKDAFRANLQKAFGPQKAKKSEGEGVEIKIRNKESFLVEVRTKRLS